MQEQRRQCDVCSPQRSGAWQRRGAGTSHSRCCKASDNNNSSRVCLPARNVSVVILCACCAERDGEKNKPGVASKRSRCLVADLCPSNVRRRRLASLYGCSPSPAAARQAARASAGAFDGTSEATVNIDRSIHLPHNLLCLSVVAPSLLYFIDSSQFGCGLSPLRADR